MQKILATLGVLGLLIVAGTETASAVELRGNCSCTEEPPFCDPDKDIVSSDLAGGVSGPDRPLTFAEGKYITDEDGDVWYCEKGKCVLTPIRTAV